MGEYAEKIKKQVTGLNQSVTKIIGEQHVPNKALDLGKMHYDARFVTSEVSDQEQFRKTYKATHQDKALDDVEIAAPQYDTEDIVLQERKYGYFDKRNRRKKAAEMRAAWQIKMAAYLEEEAEEEEEDQIEIQEEKYEGHDFDTNGQFNEHTADFMLSTRRFEAIENKKFELARVILTDEALNALKEKKSPGASVLEGYRTVIMNLGPAIEVEQDNDETLDSDIKFTAESVEAYRAYLRQAAADPVGTIETAITDTLHTVTSFPEKMLGSKAIPQTFDRLMQIRNRYNAINQLRVHRKLAGEEINPETDPLGALMTKLYPREDKAADKKSKKGKKNEPDEGHDHEHDEKENFEFIKLMEVAINSDMVRCLRDAGITYRTGMFGTKKDKSFIDSDGNAARNSYAQLKANLAAESDEIKAHKKSLNEEHWSERINAAYEEVNARHLEADQPASMEDTYGIRAAVKKIKEGAKERKKIRYNTELAGRFEDKISRISEAIDELKFRVDNSEEVLQLDQVKMSKELTNRIRSDAKRAEYDLFILTERAKGYLNAYDHVISGRKLDQYGTAIMSELDSTEEDDWVVLSEKKAGRYNEDTVRRMNAIAQAKTPEKLDAKSDREVAEKVKNYLSDFETQSSILLMEIRENVAGSKNRVIDKVVDFRKEFYIAKKLLDQKNPDGDSIPVAMIKSIEDEKQRKQALAAYQNTLTKCHYVCFYAELFRTENILNIMKNGKLPDDLQLSEAEKQMKEADFRQSMKGYQLLLNNYLDDITQYEKKKGAVAISADLTDAQEEDDEEYENELARLMDKADMTKFSDAKYPEEPVEQPVEQPIQQQEGEQPKVEDQPKEEEKPKEEEEPKVEEEHKGEEEHKEEEKPKVEEEHKEEDQPKEEEQHQEPPLQQHNEPPVQHDEQPAAYVKRITNPNALVMINSGELKTPLSWARYIANQLKVINGNGAATWDEVKQETRSWIMGKKLKTYEIQGEEGQEQVVEVEKTVNEDNVDQLLEDIKRTILDNNENVFDMSQYSEDDKVIFSDIEEGEIDYEKNGVGLMLMEVNIPEADKLHAKWFLDNLPAKLDTVEAISQYKKLWERKVGYDFLNGKKLSDVTYHRIVSIFDTLNKTVEDAVEKPRLKRQKANLDKTNVKKKVPDYMLPEADKKIPNEAQWFGASCWATSGALISRWYMENVLHDENPGQIDQMSFLDPDQLVFNPYSEQALNEEKKTAQRDGGLSGEADNIYGYLKPHGAYGSLIATADVMLSKMKNTAVRHLRFNVPLRDANFDMEKMGKAGRLKVVKQFYDRVSELMQAGSGPISLLIPGHYRTIIGFKNGKLQFRDSGEQDYAKEPSEFSLQEFLQVWDNSLRPGIGYSLELVFLQNINQENKQELEQKYGFHHDEEGKLEYNEEDEKKDAQSPEKMLHKLGRLYVHNNKNTDSFLDRFLVDEIYVPKNLDNQANVQEVNEWITQTRRDLGLKEPSEAQKQEHQRKKLEFEQIGAQKRQEYNERIKGLKPHEKTIDELMEEFDVLESEGIAQEVDDYVKTNEERVIKETLGDKFQGKDREVLAAKVIDFKKRVKEDKRLSDKEKAVNPTALDLFLGDYEEKDKKLSETGEQAPTLGWFLNADEMATVDKLLKTKGMKFASKTGENKESSLDRINEALAAIKKGDISMYNHLPMFLKEFFGRKAMDGLFKNNKDYKDGVIPALETLSKEEKDNLTRRTRDPLFRGLVNMMITRKAKDAKGNEAWRELKKYDAYMNRQLILQTLAPMEEADKKRLRDTNRGIKYLTLKGRDDAETMIKNNQIRQRHLAKMMFLMQLGRFDRFDTDEQGNTTPSMFNEDVSEALAHGNRIGVNIPAGNAQEQQAIYDAWKGDAGDLMFGRFATHELHRKKAHDPNSRFAEVKLKGFKAKISRFLFKRDSKEKPSSYTDNYGMNMSLGGLGRSFNGGTIDDQGKFGHMYQRYRQGDADTCGGMLIGIENSAPGGTCITNLKQHFGGYNGVSCIGELHNGKAISHGQSAFFSMKSGNGDRYGGRVVDLSNVDPGRMAELLRKFDEKYKALQEDANLDMAEASKGKTRLEIAALKKKKEKGINDLNTMNRILSGKIMSGQHLYKFLKLLGFNDNQAKATVEDARSIKGADYTSDEQKYPKRMYEVQINRDEDGDDNGNNGDDGGDE